MVENRTKRQLLFFLPCAVLLTAALALHADQVSASGNMDELWFSAMPRMSHEGRSHQPAGKPGLEEHPATTGPGSSHNRGGHGGHESEHRPKPVRTYWLNTCGVTENAEAFVMRPEGEYECVAIDRKGHEVSVSIRTPLGEGPAHGANYVYLVDRFVDKQNMVISTAKWLTIHHNCGWGHDHRFNPERLRSHSFIQAPLEIVVDNLWDKNFHSTVMSGDMITFRVFSFGKPAGRASVLVESEKGWQKEVLTNDEGLGSFQMLRDYYPASWQAFNRSEPGRLKFTARYETQERGRFKGEDYDHVRMNTTFSWRYFPARQEYVSYRTGLLIAFIATVFSGFGVFYYRERRKKPYREIRFDEKNQ
jgi:hypothetical protein